MSMLQYWQPKKVHYNIVYMYLGTIKPRVGQLTATLSPSAKGRITLGQEGAIILGHVNIDLPVQLNHRIRRPCTIILIYMQQHLATWPESLKGVRKKIQAHAKYYMPRSHTTTLKPEQRPCFTRNQNSVEHIHLSHAHIICTICSYRDVEISASMSQAYISIIFTSVYRQIDRQTDRYMQIDFLCHAKMHQARLWPTCM